MKLWRKAAGAIKDKNSIWIASLSRRTPYRHPDLEATIIKATSHDESKIDYKNARRVFEWVRTSPIYIKPLAWGLSSRMHKTRDWVVALKGLMLIHGVFCMQIPAVQRIGRLPFDLSNFKDNHSSDAEVLGIDSFIRSYYAYLDQKSVFTSAEVKNQSVKKGIISPLMDDLNKLENLQLMLDMLLQIKPRNENLKVGLILEAMNNLVIEVFDVYSRICNGIAQALLKIYDAPTRIKEASMALKIVQKAALQVDDLSLYLEQCRDLGVINASECPKLEKIPEEDIKELDQIINGGTVHNNNNNNNNAKRKSSGEEEAINETRKEESRKVLKTVITDKWEVFEGEEAKSPPPSSSSAAAAAKLQDPFAAAAKLQDPFAASAKLQDPFAVSAKLQDPFAAAAKLKNPFAASAKLQDPFAGFNDLIVYQQNHKPDLPDLITF